MSLNNFYDKEDKIDVTEKNTKVCVICGEEKDISEFHAHDTHQKGRDNRCKTCKNKLSKDVRQLKKIAPPKPESCECCGRTDVKLVLDHDHITKKIRGWICKDCNTSIGNLGDNIKGVSKAFIYLILAKFNFLKRVLNGRHFQRYNIFNFIFKKR